MNGLSAIFIHRPIGTTLMAIGLMLAGLVAYVFLPIASLPNVELPTIQVSASRPGADPSTMAASVAAPLERSLGSIPGVTEITSQSSLGSTNITIQFDLARNIDSAGRDVQAALNAAVSDLPGDLPALPNFRKANPNSQPVLILALTSDTLPPDAVYDLADTVIAQRISQVNGVAQVQVNGAEQPAVRVRFDPARLASMGLAIDDVRAAIVAANTYSPLGAFDGDTRLVAVATSGQLAQIEDYANIVVRTKNGASVRLGDVAEVARGVRNTRAAGWFNGKPAVLVQVTKQPEANVIQTVDAVTALLPEIKRWIPAGVDFNVMLDRTITIRASVSDLQKTLAISIALVMVVVFLFLRRGAATLAAGITVPLSLAGTFACMWAARFTLDNFSLMAIVISVGFVVDDAIVMIENVHRNMEAGMDRMQAALSGARQIGFTVIAISVSLIAAFIPMLFMPGIMGRLFREFSLTMTFAIIISAAVSLTVTPMICGRYMGEVASTQSRFDRVMEAILNGLRSAYARSLGPALARPGLSVLVVLVAVGLTIHLFRVLPKGTVPQDDIGLMFAWTQASTDVSFPQMQKLQQKATDIIVADPAIESTASFIGGGGSVNNGRMFISLKPLGVRHESTQQVINRLRVPLNTLAGMQVYLVPMQDIRVGGRQGRSNFQFTLWGSDSAEIDRWAQATLLTLRKVPEIADVSSDREKEGLQALVSIDRVAAARLGVSVSAIDAALSDAFSQRQVSTIYGDRNQYKVVLEVAPERQRDPSDLTGVYVTGAGGLQVPLSSVAKVERGIAPLSVNHTGQFVSATISYTNAPDVAADTANAALQAAVLGLHMPDTVHADFAGDAKALADTSGSEGLLILAALICVYLILGILYESLVHPLTIVSTLPSAGLGALVAIAVLGMELTVIAFIGLILLIGIVKKNGIMLVDFAITGERVHGLTPRQAIEQACVERFRPILMTTMAAMCGAIPLLVATGAGAELRRPLGVAIVGGLMLSQLLTLYTTPVIYLLMSRFVRRNHESSLQKIGLSDVPQVTAAE